MRKEGLFGQTTFDKQYNLLLEDLIYSYNMQWKFKDSKTLHLSLCKYSYQNKLYETTNNRLFFPLFVCVCVCVCKL